MKKYLIIIICISILMACTSKQRPEALEDERSVLVNHPAMLELISEDAQLVQVITGFRFTEGPTWSADGFLLFSDIPASRIYKWSELDGLSVYQEPSYNSNGLLFTDEGDLLACEHGSRVLRRINTAGEAEVLASHYMGKRLNSPNDLTVKSDGSIYFTDPPYGLSDQDNDAAKELSFNGIYRYKDGELFMLDSSMIRPNGIAFSPDERTMYVAQSEIDHKWMKFTLDEQGNIVNAELFFDADDLEGKGTPDGLKVDSNGNLYCSGPGGIVIFSAEAKYLGTIRTPEVATNCAFGGSDGKTLFITAQSSVYSIRLK